MIAALPMYDRAEVQAANDALWASVRARLGFGPERLDRDKGLWEIWTDPDLVLAQTCNLPYRMRLHGTVQIVGHPDYDLPYCQRGYYNSVFVTPHALPHDLSALLRKRVVINQTHSQSGNVALLEHAQTLGVEPNIVAESGGHMQSARMLWDGEADLALIDAQSWRMIRRYDPDSAALREVTRTRQTPATPFICGPSQDVSVIRQALTGAIADLSEAHRMMLNLKGLVSLPVESSLSLPIPPQLMAQA
ncbi:phosphate/phosphite/phosphonate ABC transporter substrate-binding protein [Pacificoceanicola onchidii]|uniref:phosphate/phosphite/phosphonate ABC transporter substrate-binding protein n=1 Tax=Pacificoceanicola onchidii TaxID=2562685 RepID=UPI0010A62FF4|nr:PhnD/SsuA/transferrin family substrate-binding protein [Pacificoceanicola onchidii]